MVRAIIRPNASRSEFDLVSKIYASPIENLSWHYCELYDVAGLEDIIEGCEYVMHLAGVISYLQRDIEHMMSVNQGYTANVVNVSVSAGVKKLLYCSSIAAITKSTKGDVITEEAEWDNEVAHSNYGYSKHLGECEMWRAQEEGLEIVAINPGIILGFGNWTKGSNKLFGNANSNFPFYSQGITGWVGVQDVARVAEQLCLSDITGERYIVISENKTFKEVSDLMTNTLGTKKPSIEINGFLYKLAYGIVSIKEFLGIGGMLSKETVKASIAKNRFSNEKVKEALNIQFQPISDVVESAVSTYKKSPSA
jgi:nucleoside-diphosphate-sugar epimerase